MVLNRERGIYEACQPGQHNHPGKPRPFPQPPPVSPAPPPTPWLRLLSSKGAQLRVGPSPQPGIPELPRASLHGLIPERCSGGSDWTLGGTGTPSAWCFGAAAAPGLSAGLRAPRYPSGSREPRSPHAAAVSPEWDWNWVPLLDAGRRPGALPALEPVQTTTQTFFRPLFSSKLGIHGDRAGRLTALRPNPDLVTVPLTAHPPTHPAFRAAAGRWLQAARTLPRTLPSAEPSAALGQEGHGARGDPTFAYCVPHTLRRTRGVPAWESLQSRPERAPRVQKFKGLGARVAAPSVLARSPGAGGTASCRSSVRKWGCALGIGRADTQVRALARRDPKYPDLLSQPVSVLGNLRAGNPAPTPPAHRGRRTKTWRSGRGLRAGLGLRPQDPSGTRTRKSRLPPPTPQTLPSPRLSKATALRPGGPQGGCPSAVRRDPRGSPAPGSDPRLPRTAEAPVCLALQPPPDGTLRSAAPAPPPSHGPKPADKAPDTGHSRHPFDPGPPASAPSLATRTSASRPGPRAFLLPLDCSLLLVSEAGARNSSSRT
ncbi:nascent polypeptide-associated complex subunit alpha, muscle-specific form-like [Cavia porcellus]|uniref:nascent polypeptide-associated complex subunit alpha, muscle-specific form-like n=1 Tax=Cavia porcellus TaxID=10141 RepID=UPI002FDF7186